MPSDTFKWSPIDQTVHYNTSALSEPRGSWSLLHETAHGLLQHTHYTTDISLLLMEVAAWQHAKQLAKQIGIQIDNDHIEDCLDTYRDWLHKRSTCPTCANTCLQVKPSWYHCHNCNASWRVSQSRFARPYRSTKPA